VTNFNKSNVTKSYEKIILKKSCDCAPRPLRVNQH